MRARAHSVVLAPLMVDPGLLGVDKVVSGLLGSAMSGNLSESLQALAAR